MDAATTPLNALPETLAGRLTLGAIARLDPETLLHEHEAAEVLLHSKRTLERWRSLGKGPKAKKIGARRVAYTVGAVLEFAGVAA
ncbi:DNA-binding protein [Bradyrhizobium pachyrhizi]|uniref:DNA-binding protein n=1 Tax=Bradyrhizobium pachyrhizi TaxID=280333 RepID=A0A844T4E9_9BRAD|nr:DNA-binding protein [Bradyrhizobium pachyrhizi]MVT69931.1 DNA-binding protein [Bradyrhizobium pachyrhizi]